MLIILIQKKYWYNSCIVQSYIIVNCLMNWTELSNILRKFYSSQNLEEWFEKDNKYLLNAYYEIEKLWFKQYRQIEKVKFVMLSEAPLWGDEKRYIYNLEIDNSQFFYRSVLADILDQEINDKIGFIKKLNRIGFIILDVSPFALNEKDTKINYRKMKRSNYRQLMKDTLQIHFLKKVKMIKKKKDDSIKSFYRYCRLREASNCLIEEILIEKNLIKSGSCLSDISKKGGGIDKDKLKQIISISI